MPHIFQQIGFIGGGKMATAVARGIVEQGLVRGEQLRVADPNPAAINDFLQAVPEASAVNGNRELVVSSDLVFLAVKPQRVDEALDGIEATDPGQLWVSVMAGVSIDRLRQRLATDQIVRWMPNTPCLIGAGAVGMASGPGVGGEVREAVQAMAAALGGVVQVPESLMDAVTGLSGSGPAYVFTFLEALIDGGVLVGLSADQAQQLAVDTLCGAAQLVRESGRSPGELRRMVASPGGTTIAGLQALERGAFRATVIAAVESATRRAADLGAEANDDYPSNSDSIGH